MSINEAIFITDKEKKEVITIISKFQRSTNQVLKIKEITFNRSGYDEKYQGKLIGFAIKGREFKKNPISETWENYIDRIKGYLFDLIMETEL